MYQAFLVSSNDEFVIVQVGTPLLHCHKDGHALLIGGEATVLGTQGSAHVGDRVSILLKHHANSVVVGIGADGESFAEIR